MKKSFQRFEAFLRSNRLRLTKTRRIIFEEISSCIALHPNAYEVQARLLAKGQRVSLATIYRTLHLLVESGLVSSVDLGESHSHYEPGRAKKAHGHLICLSCGQVREFSQAKIRRFIEKIGRDKGYRLDKFSIQVFGFCEKCRQA